MWGQTVYEAQQISHLLCTFNWQIRCCVVCSAWMVLGLIWLEGRNFLVRVLRSLVWRLAVSGMVVRFVWVPSALQPADPLSRLSRTTTAIRAQRKFRRGASMSVFSLFLRPAVFLEL